MKIESGIAELNKSKIDSLSYFQEEALKRNNINCQLIMLTNGVKP
jgi:hypothetical protein